VFPKRQTGEEQYPKVPNNKAAVRYTAFADIPYEQEHLEIISCLVQSSGGGDDGGDGGCDNILDSTRDCHNNTHLHAAARLGRMQVVARLLRQGVNVNVINAYGETPLYLAALFRHIAIIICLLEHRADVAIGNNFDGNTPLHVAAQWGQLEAVGWLCHYGGRSVMTAHNKEGWTALDLAKKRCLYLEKRNFGNPVSTIKLLEERITVHGHIHD
jgi:Ankyrin repeats (3 copies)